MPTVFKLTSRAPSLYTSSDSWENPRPLPRSCRPYNRTALGKECLMTVSIMTNVQPQNIRDAVFCFLFKLHSELTTSSCAGHARTLQVSPQPREQEYQALLARSTNAVQAHQ